MSKLGDLLGRFGRRGDDPNEPLPVDLPAPDERQIERDLTRITQWAMFGVTHVSGRLLGADAELTFDPAGHLEPVRLRRREWIRFVAHVRGVAGARLYRGPFAGTITLPLVGPPNAVSVVVDARFVPDAIDQEIALSLRIQRPPALVWPEAQRTGTTAAVDALLRKAHGAERVEVVFDGLFATVARAYSFGTFDDSLSAAEWERLHAELRALEAALERRLEHDDGSSEVRATIEFHPAGERLRITIRTTWRD